jgi:iron complex outermembrane recepter protein
MSSNKSRVAYAVALAMAASAPSWAADEEQVLEEVQVTGSRISQAPGMETPTPVTSVQIAELEALSPGNLIDSLSTLPVFFNNSTVDSMLGGQNSGGANVNLRGAGANRTLVLLDGRRVVSSNRFGAVDVNTLPDMLLKNVETVTGGASASYGTDAVAGVVNFKLDKNFEGIKIKGQGGETSRNDGQTWEYGIAFGHKFGERLHFVGSFQKASTDPIDTLDSLQSRPWINQMSRVTNPAGTGAGATGPTFLRRGNVAPTNYSVNGLLLDFRPATAATATAPAVPASTGPLNRLQFNGLGTALSRLPFYGVGALNDGCLCQALPFQDFGVSSDDQIAAGYKRTNGFAHLNFAVSDNVNVYAEGVWGDSANDTRRESVALLSIWQGQIYSNNAFLTPALQQQIFNGSRSAITVDNTTGVNENVRSATFGVFLPNNADNPIGDTRQITRNRMSNLTVGFDANLSVGALDGWNLNGYLQKGKNRQDFNTVNGIRVDRLWLALDAVRDASGNIVCRAALPQYDPNGYLRGCAPLNLFGGTRNITPEAAAWIRDPYKVASQWIDLKTGELAMNGSLGFGLPAGDISSAVGLSYRKETLDQYTVDPADEFPALPDGRLFSSLGLAPASLRGLVPSGQSGGVAGYTGFPGLRFVGSGYLGDANSSSVQFSSLRAFGGGSNVKEGFVEFQIPLLKDLAFAQNLETNVAARYADYSGSGGIWAWKAGVNWTLNDQLRLRATRSRDVRAPNLRERFDQTRGGFTVRDPFTGQQVSGATFSGGNTAVAPELADTTTVGLVFKPEFFTGFQTSVDWYKINITDAIAQLSPQQLMDRCFAGDASLCQYIIRSGNPTTGPIERIESLFINLAKQNIEGVDVEASYRRSLTLLGGGPETASLRIFATHLLTNSQQSPGSAVDKLLGQVGGIGLPKWKATGVLSYSNGPWNGSLIGRFMGKGILDRTLTESLVPVRNSANALINTIDDNHVPSVFYTDLNVGFSPAQLEGLRMFATVTNLLDRDPPNSPSIIGRTGPSEVTVGAHDQLGRRFTVGFNYEF